jgi:CRP-like cAMP-binding protein
MISRAATIRANVPCIVYALDRGTFRNTLANSSFNKAIMITEALSKVLYTYLYIYINKFIYIYIYI